MFYKYLKKKVWKHQNDVLKKLFLKINDFIDNKYLISNAFKPSQ